MDGTRFDYLVKRMATAHSRRAVLRGLIGAAAAAGSVGAGGADAREARTRPTIPPPPAPTTTPAPPTTTPAPDPCPGLLKCAKDGCCDGACTHKGHCCPAGRSVCGNECCSQPDQCCDRECCAEGSICIGEERCCPAVSFCDGVCCNSPGQRCCGDTCLEADQCCESGECPDSPSTCQVGVCNPATNICERTDPCAGSLTGPTCCSGSCVELGSLQHCATCGDLCQPPDLCTPVECEGGACVSVSRCTAVDVCTPACGPDGRCITESACTPVDACTPGCGENGQCITEPYCRAVDPCTPACGESGSCIEVSICTGVNTCGGGGVAGECGCTPDCSDAVCGASDGCGGTCQTGSCPEGKGCIRGGCEFLCPGGCPDNMVCRNGGCFHPCTGDSATCPGPPGFADQCGCRALWDEPDIVFLCVHQERTTFCAASNECGFGSACAEGACRPPGGGTCAVCIPDCSAGVCGVSDGCGGVCLTGSCTNPTNGTATCANGACQIGCNAGFIYDAGSCVPDPCPLIELDEPGCFHLDCVTHDGCCWTQIFVPTGATRATCRVLDGCAEGGGSPGGGCYKWALSSDTIIAPPWP